ncbi:MAG: PadR family transcriptional regulator [Proteocatella sp.]
MDNKSQLLKGCLEGCVLRIIEIKGEIYGYDILKVLKENGFDAITEGTLYPMYARLQKGGLIAAVIRDSSLGPARKYYSLTQNGHDALEQFCESWKFLSNNVNNIVDGNLLNSKHSDI